MRNMAAILGILMVVAGPAAAQMTGYVVDSDSGAVSTFFCHINGDLDCFRYRTELGSIAGIASPWTRGTALSPTDQLVVVDAYNSPEYRLVWFDLPSLEVASNSQVVGDVQQVFDIAYGPDSRLWLLGTPSGSMEPTLFVVDPASGGVTAVWSLESVSPYEMTMAFVGERIFVVDGDSVLWEVDSVSGESRLVFDFAPTPYGGFRITSLSSFGGSLWSVGEFWYSGGPPPGYKFFELGSIDPDSGAYETLVMDFGYVSYGHSGFAIDLVDASEQLPPAIPSIGGLGLAAITGLIGLAGVLLARRVL